MEKSIIAFSASVAGISNRLKCLISVMRISKKIKAKPLLCWRSNNFICNAEFSELFNTPLEKISEEDVNKLIKENKIKHCKFYEDINDPLFDYFLFDDWRFILGNSDGISKKFATVLPDKEKPSIDLEYARIPLELRNDFLEFVRKLKPSDRISKKIKFFLKGNSLKNVVGLHVRRKEFVLCADGRGKVSTDELFFKRIREMIKEKPQVKFFLATDSLETEKKYVDEFGDKILTYPKKNWNNFNKENTHEAVIDLLLLSKTKHILGTYLSTFTEMAWWFGNCKADIEIIGDPAKMKEVASNSLSKKSVNNSTSKNAIRSMLKKISRSKIFRPLLAKILELKVKYNY